MQASQRVVMGSKNVRVVSVSVSAAIAAALAIAVGGGSATAAPLPTGPVLENSFVSSVGWVKPGDTYPFTLRVKNYGAAPLLNAVVTLTAPDSTTLTDPDGAGGAVTVTGNTLTWNAGNVPAISGTTPGPAPQIVEAKAD